MAGFAESDDHILQAISEKFGQGLANTGKSWTVEILSKDSQSKPNRAAEVASELILSDEVDLIVAAWTPDTVNPVSDQAELNGTPCITTDCPWQPYFLGRGGLPDQGVESTYSLLLGA